jgi:hypothetical protein
MQEYLKVKIMSLAAEAVIIRKQENKAKRQTLWLRAHKKPETEISKVYSTWMDLKQHRRWDVRNEARSALLAYGFLRGTPYLKMEAKCHEIPDIARVKKLVNSFGGSMFRQFDNMKTTEKTAEINNLVKQWYEAK